ncbi:hypothetical protein BAE44_0003680 [Dichanthelium oligosanthes]|uniref:Uncharacterized protein n=1 Tax=Dichanthelium oligosanthes TaxID=888268 RepID=A0A1E5WDI0_9POAL|nr:hypothetical protein BAE44_0003680 [Dichanthelium oligosanthes]
MTRADPRGACLWKRLPEGWNMEESKNWNMGRLWSPYVVIFVTKVSDGAPVMVNSGPVKVVRPSQQWPTESGSDNLPPVPVVPPESNHPQPTASTQAADHLLQEHSGSRSDIPLHEDPEANLQPMPDTTDQINELQKRCSNYSQKALIFSTLTFVGCLGSASSSTGNMAFNFSMVALFIAICIDLISASTKLKWGRAFVCLSWSFLLVMLYLLLLSLNKYYGYAIFTVLFPVVTIILQHTLFCGLWQRFSTNDEVVQYLSTNEANQDLDGIFNLSAGIVTCGGFINVIFGHYMVGQNRHMAVTVVGFLFFATIVLGLSLMMITTVRAAYLIRHVRHLTVLLIVLFMGTLIAALIYGIRSSAKDWHA